jgi:hypothetical protein
MGVEIELFEVGLTHLDFCLWGWMKSEVYQKKVNTRDELVARILYVSIYRVFQEE